MKQETKELVEWLKDHLSHYRNQLAAGQIKIGLVADKKEEKNAYAAINFLNSLEDIELHLCLGGYIQDINGTPCCHGDKVKFKIYNNECVSHLIKKYGAVTEGKLRWNPHIKAFCVDFGDGDWLDFTAANDGVEWFEKVE